jgi:hypothetical protein
MREVFDLIFGPVEILMELGGEFVGSVVFLFVGESTTFSFLRKM